MYITLTNRLALLLNTVPSYLTYLSFWLVLAISNKSCRGCLLQLSGPLGGLVTPTYDFSHEEYDKWEPKLVRVVAEREIWMED